MAEITLEFLADQQSRILTELRSLRRDLDMLTRIVLRLDSTVDALREDIKSLWLAQSDLRHRIENLEERA
jgi:prefoldin subunit 5